MSSIIIFLDESGDLGWKFDAPPGNGGSSRYLTISALCVPYEKRHIPKRIIRSLYDKFKWPTKSEYKWVHMHSNQREFFAEKAHKMSLSHPDISLKAIAVKKENVQEHIRKDGNKLYNYMIKLLLLNFMSEFDDMYLIPDPRAIKIESGNSLSDYLQTELWFTKEVTTILKVTPFDSKTSRGIQFADMLAGLVQSHHNKNYTGIFKQLREKISIKSLYF